MAGKTDKYRQTLERMEKDYGIPILIDFRDLNNQKTLERLAKVYGASVLSFLTSEERVRGLQPEERLHGLQPEERLSGLQPEEIVRGLSPETREKLRQLLNGQGKQN